HPHEGRPGLPLSTPVGGGSSPPRPSGAGLATGGRGRWAASVTHVSPVKCGISRRDTGTDWRMLEPGGAAPTTPSASQAGATSATNRSEAPAVRDDENRAMRWRKPISDALSVRTKFLFGGAESRAMNIRRAIPTDRGVLVDIWLRSVRAT